MEKAVLLLFLAMLVVVGSGCSVSFSTSAEDELDGKAEELAGAVESAKEALTPLKGKKNLSDADQELIARQTNQIIEKIDAFKTGEETLLTGLAKKVAGKALKEVEEAAEAAKEAAENKEAAKADVDAVLEALSDDFEISLFE